LERETHEIVEVPLGGEDRRKVDIKRCRSAESARVVGAEFNCFSRASDEKSKADSGSLEMFAEKIVS
jgi:hypothetical protein